jgi:hypothetical protein
MTEEDVREARVRRMLHRRGLKLPKSRRRDPKALDYGGYMVANLVSGVVIEGATPRPFSWSLDDVEKFLAD